MKKRLIMILLCVSCIPLIVASSISYYLFQSNMLADTHKASLEKAEAIQHDVHYFINRNMDALRLVAKNQLIVSMDPAAMKSLLVSVGKDYTDMIFIVVGSDGKQISRSDNLNLASVADRPFFKKAAGGQENISQVLISRSTNLPTIAPAVPIKDGAGNVRGVIQGSLALNKLDEFVKQRSVNGSTVFLVAENGSVIAHPDSNLKPEEKDLSKLDYIQKGLSGQNGSAEITNRNGQKALIYYVFDKENSWLTCIETPYDILNAKSRKIMYQMALLIFVTMLLVGAIGYYISGKVVNPLKALVRRFKEVAEGNLAVEEIRVSSDDEIGQLGTAFNAMLKNLKNIVCQVTDSAQQVTSSSQALTASAAESAQASNQVAGVIGDLAQGVNGQMSAVKDTSQVVDEINSAMQQVTDGTNIVAASSDKTAKAASEGEQAIKAAITQMGNIEEVVTNSAQAVGKLGERSKEIGQIIDTISNIAGQTNLLALNAAIEAARAGEQGRGFAVVADEVRKLAEQSQEAAKKIGELVGEIQGETDAAVGAMSEGVQVVKVGTDVVAKAGTAFSEISTLIQDVSRQVKETISMVQQSAQGSQRIVQSVQKIEQTCLAMAGQSQTVSAATEEQSASSQEIAASSQALARLADQLQAEVQKFRV